MIEEFHICKNLEECLKKLEHSPILAVAVSRELSRNDHFFAASNVYCFEKYENIYSYMLKFLVRKDFSHLKELNKFIQMTAIEGGLSKKWHSEKSFQDQYEEPEIVYHAITLSTCAGMYFLWFLIKTICVLNLFAEQLIHKKARQRNSKRFWKIAEGIIGPDRLYMLKDKMN